MEGILAIVVGWVVVAAIISLFKNGGKNKDHNNSNNLFTGNYAEKDNLARIMLLNIYIHDQKRVTFTWKEPFNSLLKAKTVQPGAPD